MPAGDPVRRPGRRARPVRPVRGLGFALVAASALVAVPPATAHADVPAGVPGTITTVAGGEGAGPATNVAQWVQGMAVAGDTLYAASGSAVHAIDLRTGWERVVAGGIVLPPGVPIDGQPATNVAVDARGVAADDRGNVYLTDGECDVDRIDSDGVIHRFAHLPGCTRLSALSVDPAGDVFAATRTAVVRLATDGSFTPVAGTGSRLGNTAAGPLAGADSLAFGPDGQLYIGESDGRDVIRVDPTTSEQPLDPCCYGGLHQAVTLDDPVQGVVFDASGNLLVSTHAYHGGWVRKLDPQGHLTVVAGTGQVADNGDGGPADQAGLYVPEQLTVDSHGNLYIADRRLIRRVDPAGLITRFAGVSSLLDTHGEGSGDGGQATDAVLSPSGVVSLQGDLYVADFGGIRTIDPSGVISTLVAGAGGGCPDSSLPLIRPASLAATPQGDLLAVVYNCVYRVSTGGQVTRLAGTGTWASASPASGTARDTSLYIDLGAVADARGNVYVSAVDGVLLRIAPDGQLSRFASLPRSTAPGVESYGLQALLYDGKHSILFGGGQGLERLDLQTRQITPVAGGGAVDCPSVPVPASTVELGMPNAMSRDGAGDVFVGASGLYPYTSGPDFTCVLEITPDGMAHAVAGGIGTGPGYGDGGPAVPGNTLGGVAATTVDDRGNLLVGVQSRVREVFGVASQGAPTVNVDNAPPGLSRTRAATVGFWATDPNDAMNNLSVTCAVDGRAAAPCSGRLTMSGLADGTHTLTVVATNRLGHSTLTAPTWTVDATAPRALLRSPTSPITRPARVRVSWSATDALSGVASYQVRYLRTAAAAHGGTWQYPSPWRTLRTTSITPTLKAGFRYCWSVRAVDRAGNLSAWTAARCTRRP